MITKTQSLASLTLLVALISLGLRAQGLYRGFWWDEYQTYATIAGFKGPWPLWHQNIPPFFYPLLQLWYRLSADEAWLRTFPLIFGALTPIAVFWLLADVSLAGSLMAALATAVQPYLRVQSTEVRAYPLLYLGCALTWIGAAVYRPGNRKALAALAVGVPLAALSHTLGLLAIAGAFVAAAFRSPKLWRWIPLAAAAAGGIVASLTPIRLMLGWAPKPTGGRFFAALAEALGWDQRLEPYPDPTIPGLAWLFAHAPHAAGILLVVLIGWLARRKDRPPELPILIASLSYLALLIFTSLLYQPFLLARALAPTALGLGIAFWLAAFRGSRRQTTLAVGLAALALPLQAFTRIERANAAKENFREVENRLAAEWRPGRAVLLFPETFADQGVGTYYAHLPANHRIPLGLDSDAAHTTLERVWGLWAKYRPARDERITYLLVRGRLPDAARETIARELGVLHHMTFGNLRLYKIRTFESKLIPPPSVQKESRT